MGKPPLLKDWYTLSDAAKYLAKALNTEMGVADILQMASEHRIVLSARFVGHDIPHAHPASVKGAAEVQYADMPDFKVSIKDHMKDGMYTGPTRKIPLGIPVGDGKYIETEKRVVRLEGIFDLPMIGDDRLEVEERFQRLLDLAPPDKITMDGAFVEGQGGQLFQLVEHMRNNRHARQDRDYPDDSPDSYYPTSLPEGVPIVVRAEEIDSFLAELDGNEGDAVASSTPIQEGIQQDGKVSKRSLLRLIRALMRHAKIDTRHGANAALQKVAVSAGDPMDEKTIKSILAGLRGLL